ISGIEFYSGAKGTITSSSIVGNEEYGIWVHGSANVAVTDSQVYANGSDGIYVYESAETSITDNEIMDNNGCGVRAESSDNILSCSGNTVGSNDDGDFCGHAADRCK
ncbi:right-handed parallel beta-helix repeat-containing protein, partial [Candidatus Bipolaricaulota bacterium]|nr:right-handed parallel beta-helix repeat-containing protein [Candidatus Bipolaricaulota bacterium]